MVSPDGTSLALSHRNTHHQTFYSVASSKCYTCEKGKYDHDADATTICTGCPSGRFTNTTGTIKTCAGTCGDRRITVAGASSEKDCLSCIPGVYTSKEKGCPDALRGWFDQDDLSVKQLSTTGVITVSPAIAVSSLFFTVNSELLLPCVNHTVASLSPCDRWSLQDYTWWPMRWSASWLPKAREVQHHGKSTRYHRYVSCVQSPRRGFPGEPGL